MANYVKNNKKKALLARKEKLLEEIQYYQKRINDFDANAKSNPNNFESESSDSDTDLPTFFDTSPPQSLLKLQQASWQTSLQATLELTGLEVLQSEINILTSEPTLEHGPPVEKEGLWHEVALRCKVDRVPFGITFLMHQADGQFGARSYRNVTLIPEKAVHDSELSKSVLNDVTTPADALDVVKSYAAANRSRRTSLAQLAEKYTESLFMEPLTNGGYVLKCADLLEVCWTLVNTWLPMSHFRHRMKFELEYMNESYIKIITHLHRQLSDPSLDTDERTLLLSKIISTCLEAKAPTEELYASVESDPETAQILRKRRTTLDQEVDEPAMKKKKDSEVMAPPKSLPKKAKPKGKENNNLKRPSGGDGTVSKKMKLTDSSKSVNERSEIDGQNEKKSTNADQVNEKGKGKKKTMTEVTNSQNMDNFKENNGTNVEEIKNNVKAKNKNPKSSIKSQIEKNVTTSKRNDEVAVQSCPSKSVKNKVDEDKSTKISKKSNVKNAPATEIYREEALRAHASKSGNKNVDEQSKPKISKNNNAQNVAMAKKNGEEILQASAPKSNKNVNGHANPKVSKKSTVQKNVATSKISAEGSSQARASKSANKNGGELRNLKISRKSDLEKNTTTKNSDEDVTLAGVSKFAYNNAIEDKNLSNKNTAGKVKVSNKDINIDEPVTNAVKLPEKNQKDSNKLKVNEKKSVHTVNNKNINEKNIVDKNNKNKAAVQSIGTTSKLSSQNDKQKVVEKNMAKLKNTAEKVKIAKVMQENNNNATKAIPNKGKTTTNKILSNIQSDGNQKISKIPQKKMSAPVSTMKKNPLRISPRKLPFRMTPQSSTKKIQKPITNIPRHTVGKVWEDTTVKSSKQAFLDGLSTGAKNPVSKGNRLIILHIGSEKGFVGESELVFECKGTGDYHESMNAQKFEKWFEETVPRLEPNAVVVMDNASYHSRRQEKVPVTSWRKDAIQEWLSRKNISYEASDTKVVLLEKVKAVKDQYQSYVIDEMAKGAGLEILRLPPYHCELNPIELIWADIKGYVARKNTTFKMVDVKKLLEEAIKNITSEKWSNCVQHVIKEEDKMYGLDDNVDKTIDSFIVNVTDSSTESSEFEDSEDSEVFE